MAGPTPFEIAVLAAGATSLLAWLALALHPARAWNPRPIGEDEPPPADPPSWPSVVAIVPARNEADVLARTLPALLSQDYPGRLRVVLVDDRSADATRRAAVDAAERCGRADALDVVPGAPLPEGWIGKPWAMEQGLRAARAGEPFELVLLTDADVLHAPRSLRTLVAELAALGLALNSRMARLPARTLAERLLLPPYVWFFSVLYPPRWVADPARTTAAAAGGCVLVRRAVLEDVGGFGALRDRVIDDVSLARLVKARAGALRLAFSRGDVASLRGHDDVGSYWRMVRRTAFTELRRSWLRVAACLAALALTFVVPPALVVLGAASLALGEGRPWALVAGTTGAAAWGVSAALFRPAGRLFGLSTAWSVTLPAAGVLHAAMTLDSALRQAGGRREPWREPAASAAGTEAAS